MKMPLADIARILGLPAPEGGDVLALGAAIDSRTIKPGDIFVCVLGEKADGHDFAAIAVAHGAVAVVAERHLPISVPVFVVADTTRALGQIAAAWRDSFSGMVVAITGSAGKTTIKEVLAHILAGHGPVAKNALNLNNQLGMPLSVLATSGEEAFWILELGISQPHDMDELGAILRPDIALLLNAGVAHTEGLGENSVEGTAKARGRGVAYHKASLLRYLRPGGTALVCADYPELAREARALCPTAQFFSATGKPLTYRAAYSGPAQECGSYRLWLERYALDITAPFCGAYGAENSIAIAAVAHILGMEGRDIAARFADAALPPQRFSIRHAGAWRLIDDTYNANPLSMARMLDAAVEIAADSPLYTILGAMGELGEAAQAEHEKLGRLLALNKVKAVFWRGPYTDALRSGLMAEHFTGALYCPASTKEFLEIWRTAQLPSGCVLCKGSRSNHLEEWLEALLPVLNTV